MEARLTRTDVAVVGGGIAGLTVASYLARAGVEVAVFEKAPAPGGRAATREIGGGFRFNRGGHALYTGGAATQVLSELGVTYGYGIPKDTFVHQGGRISAFPTDPLGLLRSDLLGVRDKLDLFRFFATLGTTRPHTLARTSVQEWISAKVKRPQLHRIITSFARSFMYTSALDIASAEVFVEKFQRVMKQPIHYIDGGWQILADGLREVAERAGANILSDARVEAVEIEDGRARGVRLRDGRTVHASTVVLATNSRDAARLVDNEAHPELRRISDKVLPVEIASLEVALERLPAPENPIVQDLDGPRFASAQSVYAKDMAPEGAAYILTFKQLDPRRAGDPRQDEKDLEDFLDAVQPGWREVLVNRQYLPRIEAVGALPLAGEGGLRGRPGPRVPGLGGLYLAGDWIGAEGYLVDASAASARNVARLLLKAETSSESKVAVGSGR